MSNTGTNIATIEKNMPMDRIGPMVEALDMNKKRFLSTVMLACERNPKMMDFPVNAHVQWAASAAALGLEPDGVSGQAFPIPFGKVVQLIIGYKGFNTMAGRAGITINSGTIMEGDTFDMELRAGHPFTVSQAFGNRSGAKLLGVWAQPQMPNGAYGHPLVLDASEIAAVKAKAPGGRKRDSPWNDPQVGYPAMAQKTAIRRLQRTLPALITPGRMFSTHQIGAQMDLLHEEVGHHTNVDMDGNLHDNGAIDMPPSEPETAEVKPEIALPNGDTFNFGDWANYPVVVNRLKQSDPGVVKSIGEKNKGRLVEWRMAGQTEAADAIEIAIDDLGETDQ